MKCEIFSAPYDYILKSKIDDFLATNEIKIISTAQSDNGEMLTITIFYEEEKNDGIESKSIY